LWRGLGWRRWTSKLSSPRPGSRRTSGIYRPGIGRRWTSSSRRSRLLDALFERQAWAGNAELRTKLEADGSPRAIPARGVRDHARAVDRQDHFKPFASDGARPPGPAFIRGSHRRSVRRLGQRARSERAALEGLFTVVERRGADLVAVPYSKAYSAWLEAGGEAARGGGGLTDNPSLATFLRSRALAFRSDDYYASDKDWMDLESRSRSPSGRTRPTRTKLLGLKARSSRSSPSPIRRRRRTLEVQADAPRDGSKPPDPGARQDDPRRESPIRVVDLVYSSGDARKASRPLPSTCRMTSESGPRRARRRSCSATSSRPSSSA